MIVKMNQNVGKKSGEGASVYQILRRTMKQTNRDEQYCIYCRKNP